MGSGLASSWIQEQSPWSGVRDAAGPVCMVEERGSVMAQWVAATRSVWKICRRHCLCRRYSEGPLFRNYDDFVGSEEEIAW